MDATVMRAAARCLITTPLDAARAQPDSLLLGEWCVLYGEDCQDRSGAILPYHWNEPGKQSSDYAYLKRLYASFINRLAPLLSDYHHVEGDERYWEIVVGSWLVNHISTLFDRWESIRLAYEKGGTFSVARIPSVTRPRPPRTHLEYIFYGQRDAWNHVAFLDIIESRYANQTEFVDVPVPVTSAAPDTLDSRAPAPQAFGTRIRHLLRRAPQLLERIWSSDVVLYSSFFKPRFLLALQLKLGQLPSLDPVLTSSESDVSGADVGTDRTKLASLLSRAKISASDPFEQFCWRRIADDAPMSIVERFAAIRAHVLKRAHRPTIVFTATGHWHDEYFKVWGAEQASRGAKLVLSEHGGSFPFRDYIFDFEERCGDVYVTTFLEHHPRHRLLPPTKYVGWRRVRRAGEGRNLCLISYEMPRYALRANSTAQSTQALDMYRDALRFSESLDEAPRSAFRIKAPIEPPAWQYRSWDFRERYADRLGAGHVYPPSVTLEAAFEEARVAVCTYPQSTFTEAVLSGLPCVMFFDPQVHGIHPIAADCLQQLVDAGVIHFDPVSAARHVNAIWNDPAAWYGSPRVRAAVAEFLRCTRNDSRDPLSEWVRFFDEVRKRPVAA